VQRVAFSIFVKSRNSLVNADKNRTPYPNTFKPVLFFQIFDKTTTQLKGLTGLNDLRPLQLQMQKAVRLEGLPLFFEQK
jgi:hypothetical protein